METFSKEKAREEVLKRFPEFQASSPWKGSPNQVPREKRHRRTREEQLMEFQVARVKKAAEIWDLYRSGISTEEIAKSYGVTREAIYRYLRIRPEFANRIKGPKQYPKTCPQCLTVFQAPYSNRKQKCCSMKCHYDFKAPWRLLDEEGQREFMRKRWRTRTTKYYHDYLKFDPEWKKKNAAYQLAKRKKKLLAKLENNG